MEIIYFDTIKSTHLWLLEQIDKKAIKPPFGVYANEQTDGVGSRNNEWIGYRGNLFFSFCVNEQDLPEDLPLSSISIYFAWIFLEILRNLGSKIWLKWPNDFYLDSLKIGGLVSMKKKNMLVVSTGINLVKAPQNKGILDIQIEPKVLIDTFVIFLEKKFLWKQIFSKYKVEFQKSKFYQTHIDNLSVSLENALLCEDGSIKINGKKVYSLR